MGERPRGFSKEAGEERLRKQKEIAKDDAARRESWMGKSLETPTFAKPDAAPKDDAWEDPWAEFDNPIKHGQEDEKAA